ncbi:MAG: cobalt ECF transporter T component CbiQ [Anaerolineales bacterium]
MHIHYLDPYEPRQSPVHRLDGRVKLVLALGLILALSLLPAPSTNQVEILRTSVKYALLFFLLLSVSSIARLGVRFLLKRSFLALPFVLAALPLIFIPTDGERPLLSLGFLALYSQGLLRFAFLALKSWLAVQVAILMIATTPFPDLLQAMRAIGVPRLLVSMFSLTWRYLFVLADEALRLMRARAARSGDGISGLKRVLWDARVTGGMAASLLIRSFERADRIYFAMLARGYDGEIRTLPLPRLSAFQQVFLFLGLCFSILFVLL